MGCIVGKPTPVEATNRAPSPSPTSGGLVQGSAPVSSPGAPAPQPEPQPGPPAHTKRELEIAKESADRVRKDQWHDELYRAAFDGVVPELQRLIHAGANVNQDLDS
eukprot:RCo005589